MRAAGAKKLMVKLTNIKAAILVSSVVVLAVGMAAPWSINEDRDVIDAVGVLGGEWVGRTAPEFELQDPEGRTHRLSEYRGKVVFLNFWASYCAPCREEMPSMEALVRQYAPQGMVMVSISHDPEAADMNAFMKAFLPGERSSMTVLWDPETTTSKRFGTELIPETYIIDRDGRIVARFVNAYDWTRPEVKQLIESLLRSDEIKFF